MKTSDTSPKGLPSGVRPRTQLVHGGTSRSQNDETSEALYMTSGYVYGSAEEAEAAFATDGLRYVYSRFANPTVSMFERRLAEYEGAPRCWATSSGMSAVFAALMCQVRAGDRVVAPRALFGSCLHIIKNLLPLYGVEAVLVDGADLGQWREALSRPTRAVFIESPSNPMLELVDLQAVADLAHAAGALVIVDNVFATPVLQRPLTLGADVVVYSATKHIDGQGRSLGGAILADEKFGELLGPFLRHTGPALSPFNAWLLLKGLETLELRVAAQVANAEQVARFLEGHRAVRRVVYPGLESHPQAALARRQMSGGGTLVAFEIAGGKAEAFRAMNALRVIRISNNLGDAKSLITHPATSTHAKVSDEDKAKVGIGPASLRLSVGLEDPRDLIDDLERALAAA
ncbi:O-succinylhomoserine sulfhydrylase [Arenibaculum pallidiluteum]|uniref:O-succinylhomoserine sulfhydrylase n=1 Tax=Arenibaculum pallidiluteum TaxID=2812559 RepID=UPI001A979E1E|nr:O-succinylhomoserine sulfhydrylase [Arenibaculum pallidiluteum]